MTGSLYNVPGPDGYLFYPIEFTPLYFGTPGKFNGCSPPLGCGFVEPLGLNCKSRPETIKIDMHGNTVGHLTECSSTAGARHHGCRLLLSSALYNAPGVHAVHQFAFSSLKVIHAHNCMLTPHCHHKMILLLQISAVVTRYGDDSEFSAHSYSCS